MFTDNLTARTTKQFTLPLNLYACSIRVYPCTSVANFSLEIRGMRGFTLLEMLVVLVVASIMLSVVTLNLMPSAQTVLREESQRLAFLMENGAMSSQVRRTTAGMVRHRQQLPLLAAHQRRRMGAHRTR